MSISDPNSPSVLIRCPSCSQRFKVAENLRQRTVECGGCYHRFKIDDEVIVRGRKFYPGERSESDLDHFQRVPMPSESIRKTKRPAIYGKAPDPAVIEPTSPLRILTGAAGVAACIVAALLLIFGGQTGTVLDGMSSSNRLVIAGFTSVMALIALLYANPKARLKALVTGVIFGAILLSLPFFFETGSRVIESNESENLSASKLIYEHTEQTLEKDHLLDLKNQIGIEPVISEIEKMTTEKTGKYAIGLWLRGLSYNNRFVIRDYMIRATDASPGSHLFPRDGGSYLLVMSGITQSIQELADIAAALGKVENIYTDLSVIEVKIDSDIFVESPLEKLTDKLDPEFYFLNREELESVDVERIQRAVTRLKNVEPTKFRTDITRRLISLLNQKDISFKEDICTALSVWSENPGPASEAAMNEVKKMMENKQVIPIGMIDLIVKEKNIQVIPILDELWYKDQARWESLYSDFGKPIESTMLRRFPQTSAVMRHSAVRILGRVGGSDSLSLLTDAQAGSSNELKIIIDQAKKSIMSRLNL